MSDNTGVATGIDVKATLWAAFIAGAVFMMLEMLMVPVFMGGSPWAPPRMIAAIAMGKGVLPPPPTFDAVIMLVAMLIHFGLSVFLAFLFAFIARGRAIGMAIGLGVVFGIVVYLVSFYGMTTIFPWFAKARGWIPIFAHIVYGAVLGLVYVSVARKTAEGVTPARQGNPHSQNAGNP
ncbi:hypothetical protein [Chromatocurvus halotolerans]|uniref:Sodium:proline symporter n=1 Tax=Chromatocurvus halotolerans TaxID=1132028 RepID=A0A4R2LF33_9GAMM|nr:hypothetical protein [Chromatocurvus halotolerans]TCO77875.1 hypothetical protein EV688_102335 [Chromatocurvus halotolerans]